MLNNKGFAVSSVLYALLIAFLLFLGAALAQFSSSSSLIGKANDDIINGNKFSAEQVRIPGNATNVCGINYKWFQKPDNSLSNTLVKIKSRYGTMYWPKDFGLELKQDANRYFFSGKNFKTTNNIEVKCLDSSHNESDCNGYLLQQMGSSIEIPLVSSGTGPSNNRAFISKDDYNNIKETIEQIEQYESETNNDAYIFESGMVSYYTKAEPVLNDRMRKIYENSNIERLEDNYYNELFDEFSNYLYSLAESDSNYKYNRYQYVFTFSIGNFVRISYYPVMYKINNINEEVIYFDLVPQISSSSISGGDVDMLLFKKDDDPFNIFKELSATNTILFKEFKDIDASASREESYYTYLKITDTISEKEIELKLYDICE